MALWGRRYAREVLIYGVRPE